MERSKIQVLTRGSRERGKCVVPATAEITERVAAFVRRPVASFPPATAFDPAILESDALEAARIVWGRRVVNEGGSVEVAQRLFQTSSAVGDMPNGILSALERLEADEVAITRSSL